MSEPCSNCGQQHGVIVTICQGTGTRYLARIRYYGHRRYIVLGQPSKSHKVALRRLAKAFAEDTQALYKRGDVLLMADYYDPEQLYELVRR